MHCLPFTSDAERTFTVDLDGVSYNVRTYYVLGQKRKWLMDIADTNNNPLISGIPMVTGALNVFNGYGNILEGIKAVVYAAEDALIEQDDALGNGLTLFWYGINDPDYTLKIGDPMDNVGVLFGEDFSEKWRPKKQAD